MDTRKSFVELDKIYFWTATINSWNKLLQEDAIKAIVTSSLKHLSVERKVEVYAFVIMPNHIHLIWQFLQMNGKEKPHTSFLKYTAHAFKKHLNTNNPQQLQLYAVDSISKDFEFWKRDSLPFELLNKKTLMQKMDYLHNNPNTEHWKLCKEPADYYYSSASFYKTGIDHFGFLTHIGNAI